VSDKMLSDIKIKAGITGGDSEVFIDGVSIGHLIDSADLSVGVGQVTRLTVTYLCIQRDSVSVEGYAEVHHLCPYVEDTGCDAS